MRDVTLPSGAKLMVAAAPFAVSKTLYMVILDELKGVALKDDEEFHHTLLKLFAQGLSSKSVDLALANCLARCTYNGMKIDDDTFEPVERRKDYVQTQIEVVKENVSPFFESLFAQLKNGVKIQEFIQGL